MFIIDATPQPIVMRLIQQIVKSLALPDVRQQLATFDSEPIGSTPEPMTAHVNAEIVKWAKVARDNAKLTRGSLY